MKRVFLFVMTNIAVLAVLSIVCKLLGVDQMLARSGGGLNFQGLLIMSGVFGMGGAFISLAISKWMALRSTGAKVITQPGNPTESWLLATVQRQAQAAGIGMPDVAIFEAAEPNAFATGMNKNKALVAVSTGLLRGMKQDEVEAVLGHEISHVANGDMVTLTLIQGVLNTFVIFLSRVIGQIIDRAVFKNERGNGIGSFMMVMLLQILLGFLASMIVCWFSRQREFRADAGGARLAGRHKMIGALERLKAAHGMPNMLPQQMTAFGIRGGRMAQIFSTHPPLDVRIAALQAGAGAVQ